MFPCVTRTTLLNKKKACASQIAKHHFLSLLKGRIQHTLVASGFLLAWWFNLSLVHTAWFLSGNHLSQRQIVSLQSYLAQLLGKPKVGNGFFPVFRGQVIGGRTDIFSVPRQSVQAQSTSTRIPGQQTKPGFKAVLEDQKCGGQLLIQQENILEGRDHSRKALLLNPSNQNSLADRIQSRILSLKRVLQPIMLK